MATSCLEEGFSIKCSANLSIVGPTSCGKTTLLRRLMLENPEVFAVPLKRIRYCYGSWQPIFTSFKPDRVLPLSRYVSSG